MHRQTEPRLLRSPLCLPAQVIKNQNAYYQQARVEVGILQLLNGRLDPDNEHHIVRLHDAFVHKGHLCLAFEQLGINLFELLKRNGFRGLSLGLLRLFLEQVRLVKMFWVSLMPPTRMTFCSLCKARAFLTLSTSIPRSPQNKCADW